MQPLWFVYEVNKTLVRRIYSCLLPQNEQHTYSVSRQINLLTWFRMCLFPCKMISAYYACMPLHTCPKEPEMPFCSKRLCNTTNIRRQLLTISTHLAMPHTSEDEDCSACIFLSDSTIDVPAFLKAPQDGCILYINFARTGKRWPSGSVCSVLPSKTSNQTSSLVSGKDLILRNSSWMGYKGLTNPYTAFFWATLSSCFLP